MLTGGCRSPSPRTRRTAAARRARPFPHFPLTALKMPHHGSAQEHHRRARPLAARPALPVLDRRQLLQAPGRNRGGHRPPVRSRRPGTGLQLRHSPHAACGTTSCCGTATDTASGTRTRAPPEIELAWGVIGVTDQRISVGRGRERVSSRARRLPGNSHSPRGRVELTGLDTDLIRPVSGRWAGPARQAVGAEDEIRALGSLLHRYLFREPGMVLDRVGHRCSRRGRPHSA